MQIDFDVVARGDQLSPGLNRSLIRCALEDLPAYETTIGLLAKGHQDCEVLPDVLYVNPVASSPTNTTQKIGPMLVRIKMVGEIPDVTDIRLGGRRPKWDVMERERDAVVVRLPDLDDLLM